MQNKKFYIYNIIAIGILTLIFCTINVADNDTLFHIKLGEEIINNGFITQDTFSIHNGLDYMPYAYGFDVIVYLIYSWLGFTGIIILRWLTLMAVGGILYSVYKVVSDNSLLSYLFSLLSMSLIATVVKVRPQIVSYMIFIIQLYIMAKWEKSGYKSSVIRALPFTFLALTNLHTGTCLFHLGFVGLYVFNFVDFELFKKCKTFKEVTAIIADTLKKKSLHKFIFIMVLCGIAICLNPYFPMNITYGFKTLGDSDMMMISEWRSSMLCSYFGTMFVLLFSIGFNVIIKKKACAWGFIMFFLTSVMFMGKQRFIAYFIFIVMYVIVNRIAVEDGEFKKKSKKTLGVIDEYMKNIVVLIAAFVASLCVGYVALVKVNPMKFDIETGNPIGVVNYIKENNISGRIYNDYNYGAFLLFHDIDVFVDSRADLYSSTFNNQVILKDALGVWFGEKNLKEVMDIYNLEYAVISKNSICYTAYLQREQWYKKLYEDGGFVFLEVIK